MKAQYEAKRAGVEERRKLFVKAGLTVHELPTGQLYLQPRNSSDPEFSEVLAQQLQNIKDRSKHRQ